MVDRPIDLSVVSDSGRLWMLCKVPPGVMQQEIEFVLHIIWGQKQLQDGAACWCLAESAPIWLDQHLKGIGVS